MILSDKHIKKYIEEGKIKITPKPDFEKQLGSASLDLRLGSEFRTFNHTRKPFVDTKDPDTFHNITHLIKIDMNDYFVFQPNQFVLGTTLEEISLPENFAARVDGRSSIGRLGIVVHSTAGHVDAGFRGKITLEMENIGMMPILLYPGTRICQLVFEELSSPAEVPYYKKKGAKYVGIQSPTESKLEQS
jgi:dCTP deaminase